MKRQLTRFFITVALGWLAAGLLLLAVPAAASSPDLPYSAPIIETDLAQGRLDAPGVASSVTVTEIKKLIASLGIAEDEAGYSVAVSGDTIIVGAPQEDCYKGKTCLPGRAYIFTRNQAGQWTDQQIVPYDAPIGIDWNFGAAVAISGDILVVGAPMAEVEGFWGIGAVYVYQRSQVTPGTWEIKTKLVPTALNEAFGRAISISGDTLVVGAPDWPPGKDGAIFIYGRDQGGADHWGLVKTLATPSNSSGGHFGTSVSIDGDTLIVGDGSEVFAYERNQGGPGAWGQRQKITPSGYQPVNFGNSLSVKGNTLVVGDQFANKVDNGQRGAAYVFERDPVSGLWSLVKELTASDSSLAGWAGEFGASVSLDGDTIVVGADNAPGGANMAGAAYLFCRNEGGANAWGEVNKLIASDGAAYDWFGFSVATQGGKVVIGSIADINGSVTQGAAYLYAGCKPWTLMFYLDGDENLNPFTTEVFNQLELAADNPAVNLVALWDRTANNDSAYYQVQYDTNIHTLAPYTPDVNYWPQGELNMGSPTTLANFVNWARANYPAQHYALILTDHGTGLNGSMIDDQNPTDLLTVKEMGAALAAATSTSAHKIDVLQEYACLMAMIEDGYQVRNSVDYYVASENLMWGHSTPFYATVSSIVYTTTPAQLAKLMAQSYADVETQLSKPYTISAADMSQVGHLTSTVKSLAQVLNNRMVTAAITLTNIISPAVQRFQMTQGDYTIDVKDTYVDLYDFARLVKLNFSDASIQTAAQGVMDAIGSYVITNTHGNGQVYGNTWTFNNAHGVSIFLPGKKSSFYNGNNLDFAAGTTWPLRLASSDEDSVEWGSMLVSYIQNVNPNEPDDPLPPEPVPLLLPNSPIYLPLIVKP